MDFHNVRTANSSERFNKDQLNLFDEAELEELIGEIDLPSGQEEIESIATKESTDKQKPKRRPLPDHSGRNRQSKSPRTLSLLELPVRETSYCQIGAGTTGTHAAKFKNGRAARVGVIL